MKSKKKWVVNDVIMKKRIIFCILFIVIAFVVVFIKVRSTNPMKELDSTKLTKVVIYNPIGNITITTKDEIKEVVETLQRMNLHRTIPIVKAGYAFAVELYGDSDEPIRVTITSKSVAVDEKFYSCDEQDCDKFSKLYEKLQK